MVRTAQPKSQPAELVARGITRVGNWPRLTLMRSSGSMPSMPSEAEPTAAEPRRGLPVRVILVPNEPFTCPDFVVGAMKEHT